MNVTIDSFLTNSQVSTILDYCKNTLILEDGKLSRDDNNSIRKSKVAFTKLNDFEFLIAFLIKEINRNYKFDGYQIDSDFKFQFTEYQLNEYYNWHTDSGNTPNAKRRISVVILLNDDYEGGDLVLKINGNEEIMDKKIGNLFLFDSNILHKVTPVQFGVRYSLVTWVGLKENNDHKKKLI
jgi:predicted 2-oxoglutarate/Fe(II)-dependent dioxygenase YbiX